MLPFLKCVCLLTLLCLPFNALSAVVVADQKSLSIPGERKPGGLWHFLDLKDDRYALLTSIGVMELDADFRQLWAYKFDHVYGYDVKFVYVEDQLHIVGQVHKWRIFYERNDIHVLRYGESVPLETWRCASGCLHPRVVNFFDYENPVLVWEVRLRGRQYVRIVQIGKNREWKFDSAGLSPWVRRIGSADESMGLQDIFVDLVKIESRGWKVPLETHVKSIRLSDLNLLEETPKHLNDYEGVTESELLNNPTPGYQAPRPRSLRTPRSHFWADTKVREARIGIHEKDWSEDDHGDEENGHIWWKVKTQYGIKHTRKTWYPHTLNCHTSSGEPFDSYLILAEGGVCMRRCGMTVYELRPGGLWREVYHEPRYQYSFTLDLERENEIHVASRGNIVRLDRGVDYCVEDSEVFQSSLP